MSPFATRFTHGISSGFPRSVCFVGEDIGASTTELTSDILPSHSGRPGGGYSGASASLNGQFLSSVDLYRVSPFFPPAPSWRASQSSMAERSETMGEPGRAEQVDDHLC